MDISGTISEENTIKVLVKQEGSDIDIVICSVSAELDSDFKIYLFDFQNIHVSFLRTLPPYSHQADVWVEMLKQFKYRQLVFIHSSDTDGRALLGRFQTKTQDLQSDDQEVKVQVNKNIFFS